MQVETCGTRCLLVGSTSKSIRCDYTLGFPLLAHELAEKSAGMCSSPSLVVLGSFVRVSVVYMLEGRMCFRSRF